MAITVKALDHLVMTCADVEATAEFYERVLGMKREYFGPETRPDGRRLALRFGDQKINLHPAQGNDIGFLARVATPGTEDLCFLTDASPESILRHLADCGVQPISCPVERTGARGPILSVYFRDPDGNLVEVSSYL